MMKHILPSLLLMLTSCMSGNGSSKEDVWGGSVAAPGSFVALHGTEALELPATAEKLSAYLSKTGAVSHFVGRPEDVYKSTPAPRQGSPCQRAEVAVVFSYDLQDGDFIPRYVAYVTGGQVVCIDRQFSYSGT